MHAHVRTRESLPAMQLAGLTGSNTAEKNVSEGPELIL